jgi:hypothetical protein
MCDRGYSSPPCSFRRLFPRVFTDPDVTHWSELKIFQKFAVAVLHSHQDIAPQTQNASTHTYNGAPIDSSGRQNSSD